MYQCHKPPQEIGAMGHPTFVAGAGNRDIALTTGAPSRLLQNACARLSTVVILSGALAKGFSGKLRHFGERIGGVRAGVDVRALRHQRHSGAGREAVKESGNRRLPIGEATGGQVP